MVRNLVFGSARRHAGYRGVDESDVYFDRGEVLRLRLEVSPGEIARLMKPERPYVHANLVENDNVLYRDVAIKIKGAAGSTRPWEDRPALTINVDKFRKGQEFHGLEKFHLNNSVQDGTLMHEFISSAVFRAANYPATRVSHARVSLNGRDVGMYVVKEGFDKRFIRRWLKDATGNLYDGGFVQDLDAPLQRDEGTGEVTRADLQAIVNACRLGNPVERWKTIERLIDLPSFLTFMACERLLCHWDGYCNNINNYRVYVDNKGVARFLPHGMDQVLGDIGASMFEAPRGMLASTILQNSSWRQQYRNRIKEILPVLLPGGIVDQEVTAVTARLVHAQNQISSDNARAQEAGSKDVIRRALERVDNVYGQLRVGEPPLSKPLVFDETNTGYPSGWKKVFQVADTKMESAVANTGLWTYSVKVGRSGLCIAAWKATVVLSAGEYTFKVTCRTNKLVHLEDQSASAAGIRLGDSSRLERVDGTTSKELLYPFVVEEESKEVVLVCEVRARSGEVFFDGPLLILTKKTELRAVVPLKPRIAPPKKALVKPSTKPAAVPRKPSGPPKKKRI